MQCTTEPKLSGRQLQDSAMVGFRGHGETFVIFHPKLAPMWRPSIGICTHIHVSGSNSCWLRVLRETEEPWVITTSPPG